MSILELNNVSIRYMTGDFKEMPPVATVIFNTCSEKGVFQNLFAASTAHTENPKQADSGTIQNKCKVFIILYLPNNPKAT